MYRSASLNARMGDPVAELDEKTLTFRRSKVVQALRARIAERERDHEAAEEAITEAQSDVIDALLEALDRRSFEFFDLRSLRHSTEVVSLELGIRPEVLRPYLAAQHDRNGAEQSLTALRKALAFYANAADETVVLSAKAAADTFGLE